jgi:mannose/fructose-specific phosphotransferase system component IIA
VTIVEAHGPLASRYLAVSRLADGERELYLDALIDDALTDRTGARTVTLADANGGDPCNVAAAHGAAAMPAVTAAA